ncbi:gustatory receptor 5a for trehalose-like isoform X1 [Neodiprion virginianus]|uniref:gustatory receptor 5a for trehalose-like isoform X1 n=1 Tax=Neodiprion virginianus TaxID=2961670 RepID=UPI001EE6D625|nr:gustatory receptor 5a for trehalose-like isoform X1 [Neodiprion virginianus]XP_046608079.1 gustatory receptor 5a for trehalose-like isoform X1 [Neodiprion virginianus]XP_046608080.1 gustatory receptor 5a for trehalose-like isoform X1 [Neodiprion virginianus]
MTVKRNDRRNDVDDPNIFCNGDTRKIWPLLNRRAITTSDDSAYQADAGVPKPGLFLNTSNAFQRQKESRLLCQQDPESFHCAIGPILLVAQCFGLLPVCGVLSASSRGLAFRRRTLRAIYASVLTLTMLVVALSSIVHMVRSVDTQTFEIKGGIGAATAGAVFYGNSVLGSFLFLWLAPRWAPLQQEWRAMEQLIDRWGRPRLRRKFSVITGIVLTCALLEHTLSMVKNTPNYRWNTTANMSLNNFLNEYSHNSHEFIISVWGYNLAVGMFLFVVSKIATFTWNFTDLFVMLVSTGLAERFKTLNTRMTSANATTPTIVEWRVLRENYAALSALVKRVDNEVSPIVLLSFANNLYFICLQLLNGLSRPDEDGILNSVYFFGSFAFLVARTVGVTLLAARINDQSRIALPVLYTCPAKAYCIETQRLEHQLATDDIALSGLRFFSITRNFMLAIAGAIVTYEVVLLQFNLAINHK